MLTPTHADRICTKNNMSPSPLLGEDSNDKTLFYMASEHTTFNTFSHILTHKCHLFDQQIAALIGYEPWHEISNNVVFWQV